MRFVLLLLCHTSFMFGSQDPSLLQRGCSSNSDCCTATNALACLGECVAEAICICKSDGTVCGLRARQDCENCSAQPESSDPVTETTEVVTSPTLNYRECRLSAGRIGGIVLEKKEHSNSATDCCEQCQNVAQCLSWEFNTQSRMCVHKSSIKPYDGSQTGGWTHGVVRFAIEETDTPAAGTEPPESPEEVPPDTPESRATPDSPDTPDISPDTPDISPDTPDSPDTPPDSPDTPPDSPDTPTPPETGPTIEPSPTPPPPPPPTDYIRWVATIERTALLWLIKVSLHVNASVYIEYQPRNPENHTEVRYRLRSQVSPESDFHEIYLFRLYEKTMYNFDVYFKGDSEVKHTEWFVTGGIDKNVRNKKPTVLKGPPTYELIYTARDDPAFHFAFDKYGHIVHFISHRGFPGDAMHHKRNGNIVYIPKDGSVMEVAPNGDTIADIDTECFLPHHSVYIQDNNQDMMWTFSKVRYPHDEGILLDLGFEELYGHRHDQAVDVILEVNLKEQTYKVGLDLMNVMNVIEDRSRFSDQVSDPSNYFPCDLNGTVNDWIRTNSLYVRDENFVLVGSHHLEAIFAIGRFSDGELNEAWYMDHTERSDFVFPNPADKFYGQHEVQILDNDHLLINDNGIGRPEEDGGWFTRGLELELDQSEWPWTARAVWQFAFNISQWITEEDYATAEEEEEEENEEKEEKEEKIEEELIDECEDFVLGLCISGHRGSLQRLENGNTVMIFTECDCDPSGLGYLAEINPDGELVSLVTIARGGSFLLDFAVIENIGGEIELDIIYEEDEEVS